jgi:predicted dehydrogenase
MTGTNPTSPLRVGLLGSGFMANFHLQAFVGVRNARIAGVYSPTTAHREDFAARANALDLGPCAAFASVEALVASPEIDAIWICGPNDTRLAQMRAIHQTVKEGGGTLRGVACEKPLGRDLAEAREMLRLAEDAGLNHGYLENQVFAPAVQRGKEIIWRRGVPGAGRPYLARAAEEHSGPHRPWFWQGDRQGGGVLSDMMCHSVEVARFLLTPPGRGRECLTATSANATVATLKWARPEYIAQLRETMGPTVDYAQHPAEDFARATLTFTDEEGTPVMVEATTSWSYVGPGLRIQLELLGPEYSLAFNSLSSGLSIFLSRQVAGTVGEDLVEKQSAEQGLLPVLEDEAGTYGYTAEDRHMVAAFRQGTPPLETFRDGVAVVEMLMALYRSAELGRTIALPAAELATYQPPVARGEYRPRA